MANENNAIVKVTLVKSISGRLKNQQATVAALGASPSNASPKSKACSVTYALSASG